MGDPRFHALLEEVAALHDKKQRDYGSDEDPFANVRSASDFGIAPWVGALYRANDKMRRLQKAARGSTLANEGIEDSLLDGAVYFLIALILHREEDHGSSRVRQGEERSAQDVPALYSPA